MRDPRCRLVVPAVFVLFVLLGNPAAADPPPGRVVSPSATDELRRHFDQVIALTQTRSFAAQDPERRREAVRRIAGPLFNWNEMSRRALGHYWGERTRAEQRAFTEQFARIAERAYLAPVDEMPQVVATMREPVRYLGESRDGKDVVVHTSVAYLRDLPVDFRMNRRASRWEIHDVVIDGVSAAENYGAQFRRLIAHGSFPELLDRMETQSSTRGDTGVVVPR